MVLVGGLFCWISYNRTASLLESQTQKSWLKTKDDAQKAWRDCAHFLNLTVFRLSRIPSTDIVTVPSSLVLLETLEFQKGTLHHNGETEGIRLLDSGRFRQRRFVYDPHKKPLGTLEATFSFKSFLNRPYGTFCFMPQAPPGALSFALPKFPGVFVLKQTSLSFWQYLKRRPFDLLLFFSLTSLAFLMGYGIQRALLYKVYRWQKALRCEMRLLKEKTHAAEKEYQQSCQLIALHEKAAAQRENLALKINNRTSETLHKARKIHDVLLKLASQDLESPAVLHDLRLLAKEAEFLLSRLISNHIEGGEMPVDMTSVWRRVKAIFQVDFMAKETFLKVKIPKEIILHIDPLALEIVLYNLFAQLIRGLTQDNRVEIMLQWIKGKFQLMILDDGYVLRNPHNASRKNPYTYTYLLALSPDDISNFARRLGWSLEWEKEKGGLNRTTLTIPPFVHSHENVLCMADFREKF